MSSARVRPSRRRSRYLSIPSLPMHFWRGKNNQPTQSPTTGFLRADGTEGGIHSGAKRFYENMVDQLPRKSASRDALAGYISPHIFDTVEKRWHRVQGYAGVVTALNSAIYFGYLHAGNYAGQTCGSGSRLVIGLCVRYERNVRIAVEQRYGVKAKRAELNGPQKGHRNVPFWVVDGFNKCPTTLLE